MYWTIKILRFIEFYLVSITNGYHFCKSDSTARDPTSEFLAFNPGERGCEILLFLWRRRIVRLRRSSVIIDKIIFPIKSSEVIWRRKQGNKKRKEYDEQKKKFPATPLLFSSPTSTIKLPVVALLCAISHQTRYRIELSKTEIKEKRAQHCSFSTFKQTTTFIHPGNPEWIDWTNIEINRSCDEIKQPT